MQIIIQCAATKQPNAPSLQSLRGKIAVFVAQPDIAPPARGCIFCRPDDLIPGEDQTWRELLLLKQTDLSSTLFPAWQLYRPRSQPEIYNKLASHFGPKNCFILSAGWGLVRGDFRLPDYDITFSTAPKVAAYKRRKQGAAYADFKQLPKTNEPIIFLGGQPYLPFLSQIIGDRRAVTVVARNKKMVLPQESWNQIIFETTASTNWHYSAALSILKGKLKP